MEHFFPCCSDTFYCLVFLSMSAVPLEVWISPYSDPSVCITSLSFCLQAMIRGELEVLKDWCYEAVSTFFIDQFIDYSFGHRLKMN